jgi:hypothetical protein
MLSRVSCTQMSTHPVEVALPRARTGDRVVSANVIKGAWNGPGPAVGTDVLHCYERIISREDFIKQLTPAGADIGSVILIALASGETTVGADPPDNPVAAQLWWDARDGQLYVYTGWQWVAASCCDGAIAVCAQPPKSPPRGMLWFDPKGGGLSIWTGWQWVPASSGPAVAAFGSQAPASPRVGELWWNATLNQLQVYTGWEWVPAN